MDATQKKKEVIKIEARLRKEMPRILKEIEVYEKALLEGTIKTNPIPAPQFNIE
jgi:hypothetical protein